MYDVAQITGIQLKYLMLYNNLSQTELPEADSKLYLQPGLPSSGYKTIQLTYKMHVVEPKESLYAIARKYNVTVKQLREWNQLDTDDLKIGQEIIVSK